MEKSPIVKTLDIETMPNMDMVKYLPEPVVKYGNTKDPEKRKVMRDDAVMRQIRDMIFNPLTAKVVAFSIVCNQNVISKGVVDGVMREWDFLNMIGEHLQMSINSQFILCTWNGIAFDIPFL